MNVPPAATKVFAVHLNFRSRAEQRGRTPAEPSYFLKPPSSITGDGELLRPQGSELLTYEGEIAIVIGARAKGVSPQEATGHIGWYAAANDAGLQDLRWADRGSNLLSKGHDGYTPMGTRIAAAEVRADELTLRTRVNGRVVQEASSDELIFSFSGIVADLSRFFTLEPGDVILTGTPAGAGVAGAGDVIEVELEAPGHRSHVRSVVADTSAPPEPYGAMPRASEAARTFALGLNAPRPAELPADTRRQLGMVSTATLTVQLAKHGVSACFLAGLAPSHPHKRMVGYARTLRYVAFRHDVRERLRGSEDHQKAVVESLSPGDVLVMEARGERGAGTIGDILVARASARGAAGIVTDGGVRDTPGVAELDLPTYYQLPNAESLWLKHIPMDVDVPITCAGALVMPGDVMVGDAEGVIVLPAALAERIAEDAYQQEQREAFALERVQAGESIRGLYPLGDARRAEFQAWLDNQG